MCYRLKKYLNSLRTYKQSSVILFLLVTVSFSVRAQDRFGFPLGTFKNRFSAGSVVSFYSIDHHFASNIQPRFGFNAGYKGEITVGNRNSILIGLTYLNQGLKYNGYYYKPGYTYLYDNTFPYTHTIRYQEIQLPLALKLSFNVEKNNYYTPYGFFGMGFRYLLNSKTSIVSDSTGMNLYKGSTDMSFENHLINKRVSTFLEAGLGIQKNNRENGKALFLEFTFKYSLSRLYYDGFENSNNVFIRDANLTVDVGYRF